LVRIKREWVAVLEEGDNFELWKGYYGSCSGCDSLQSEKNYEHDDVRLTWAQEYFKGDTAFLIIPKETMERLTEETFIELIPANVRNDIYGFNGKELYEEIMKSLDPHNS